MNRSILFIMALMIPGSLLAQIGKVQSDGQAIIGTWVNSDYGYQMKLVFNNDGNCLVDGDAFNYSVTASTLTLSDGYGNTVYNYALSGGQLTLSGGDLMQAMTFGREGTPQTSAETVQTAGSATNLPGTIDPTLVGKWYYYSSSSGYSGGGSSSERILEINADGTYRYYYEGSVSGKSHDMYGEEEMFAQSASQDNDSGSWRLQGNVLHTQSNVHGYQTFTLQKQNNQNNEPMILIDGDPYVTYYKRAPW